MKFKAKLLFSAILTVVLLATAAPVFAESTQTIDAVFGRVKLVVAGQNVEKETLLYNGTTYVPLRAAAEALGVEVGWDSDTSTAFLTSGGTPAASSSAPIASGESLQTIDAVFGSVSLIVDGQNLDKETLLYNGTTYVPLRAAADALNVAVGWDEGTATATLTEAKKYTLGDTITSSQLNITFGTTVEFLTLDNTYSRYHGKTVVKVAATIHNPAAEKESPNMFFYDVYNPSGNEVNHSISTEYYKDAVDYIGDIDPGTSKSGYYYFIYDGNGYYTMKFNDSKDIFEVSIPVNQ